MNISTLEKLLIKTKKKYVKLREPGGSTNSEKIRKIILNNKSSFNSLTDLLLYLASRNENVQKNSFLANAINGYLFENESITTINNLDDAVQSISNYEIVKFSKKTFTDNFIQATLLPK